MFLVSPGRGLGSDRIWVVERCPFANPTKACPVSTNALQPCMLPSGYLYISCFVLRWAKRWSSFLWEQDKEHNILLTHSTKCLSHLSASLGPTAGITSPLEYCTSPPTALSGSKPSLHSPFTQATFRLIFLKQGSVHVTLLKSPSVALSCFPERVQTPRPAILHSSQPGPNTLVGP